MKHSTSMLFIAGVILILTACKKNNQAMPAPTVVGYWTGFYVGQTPTTGYAMLFRTNGTVRVYNSADTSAGQPAEGTYAVKDSTVTTTCTYLAAGAAGPSFSTLGTWSNTNNTIKGTAGIGTNIVGAGTFSLTK